MPQIYNFMTILFYTLQQLSTNTSIHYVCFTINVLHIDIKCINVCIFYTLYYDVFKFRV